MVRTGPRVQEKNLTEPSSSPTQDRETKTRRWPAPYWPLVGLAACFAATLLIVPVRASVAVNDDWIYSRTVETFMQEGRFQLLDLSAASQVFQTLWAGAFSLIFGTDLGTFRLSTFVLVLIGGMFFFGLCREVGLERPVALLGAAVYLFNPIIFSLSTTFMTDPFFVSLLTISVYLYLRGFRDPNDVGSGFIAAGSAAAAGAFLVRQQGLFIPAAVISYLVLSKRLRLDRRSLLLFLNCVAVPALVAAVFFLWLKWFRGIPTAQRLHTENFLQTTPGERILLIWRLSFITVMYLGLFVLPLAVSLSGRIPALLRSFGPRATSLAGIWVAILLGGLVDFSRQGRLMPYLDHFLKPNGLGPTDLHGDRPALAGPGVFIVFTVATAFCAILFAIVVFGRQRLSDPDKEGEGEGSLRAGGGQPGAGLIAAVMIFAFAGIFLPSHLFRKWPSEEMPLVTLDRYVVVLLPLALCLVLWNLPNRRRSLAPAWALTFVVAVFSIAGTRDFATLHQSLWRFASEATKMGVAKEHLDAGAAWDGYHMSDGSMLRIPPKTPAPPWWVGLFAPNIDSQYIVSTRPVPGYAPVRRVEYSQWLQPRPTFLILSRRQEAPGPPGPGG